MRNKNDDLKHLMRLNNFPKFIIYDGYVCYVVFVTEVLSGSERQSSSLSLLRFHRDRENEVKGMRGRFIKILNAYNTTDVSLRKIFMQHRLNIDYFYMTRTRTRAKQN